jgi:hypothetical protein
MTYDPILKKFKWSAAEIDAFFVSSALCNLHCNFKSLVC